MESGEFSRGKESIRADGGIVMVGNFEVDVEHQQRIGHLLGRFRRKCATTRRSWTEFTTICQDGISRKSVENLLTDHFGLVSDFLSECWNQLRRQPRAIAHGKGECNYGGALSGRDVTAVQKIVKRATQAAVSRPGSRRARMTRWNGRSRLALECRRRVKEQQKRIGSAEFRNTHFSYTIGEDGVEKFVATPELYSEDSIGTDPLPPGQVLAISPGGARRTSGTLPYRCDTRSRNRSEDSQPTNASALQRKRPLRRTKSLHTSKNSGRRP